MIICIISIILIIIITIIIFNIIIIITIIISLTTTTTSMVQWLACLTTNPLAWVRSRKRTVSAQTHPTESINGYLGKTKVPIYRPSWVSCALWKLICHSGPVSWGNGLISTIGTKTNEMGDERQQLLAAIACAHTLPLPTTTTTTR